MSFEVLGLVLVCSFGNSPLEAYISTVLRIILSSDPGISSLSIAFRIFLTILFEWKTANLKGL